MLTRTGQTGTIGKVFTGLLLLSMVGGTGCNSVPWRYDYGTAVQSAAAKRRRAVVVFTSGTNADCREMDFKVFSDSKVQELMREFVPVRLDLYLNRTRAGELGVESIPAIVVIRPDGSIAGTTTGKLTPEALRLFLIKNRFN